MPRAADKCGTCKLCTLEPYVATSYEGQAQALIYALKFGRAKSAAKTIAQVMHERLPIVDVDIVTNVPTASSRVHSRGYDQAALIAKQFALLRQISYASLLVRQGQQRQVGQNRAVREQQLRSAFRPRHDEMLPNLRVLLIDDVITTGSTVCAAAAVIKRARAKDVSVAAFTAA